MKHYAGIGSRDTPQPILKRMTRCARVLDKKGYTLRSGGAKGADQAFEKGSRNSEIFLAQADNPLWTKVFVEHFHPAPHNLKEYPYKLMERNVLIMLGFNGNVPVRFVVCYTKDGKASGGTGHTMRIAEFFNIPIFNFHSEEDIQRLKEFVR